METPRAPMGRGTVSLCVLGDVSREVPLPIFLKKFWLQNVHFGESLGPSDSMDSERVYFTLASFATAKLSVTFVPPAQTARRI